MKLKEWGIFIALALIWGTSFFWIKIAVQEIGPLTLVSLRLLFGLAGLLVILRLQRRSIPRDPRTLLGFLFLGIFNYAVPFTLISWGETRIDSGLAAILNGTVPLFTILIAHLWLADERFTLPRMAGLLVGFIGVVVLVSRDLGGQALLGNVWGQLAVIGGSISYALAITFTRRHLHGQSPVVQSTVAFVAGDALMWLVTPTVEHPLRLPALPVTWLAVAWLGLLGSCLAFLMFYHLINAWGATRASLVTYTFPVLGLLLGVLFLHEAADWHLVAGSLLVVAGIAIVNMRLRPARLPAPAPLPDAATD